MAALAEAEIVFVAAVLPFVQFVVHLLMFGIAFSVVHYRNFLRVNVYSKHLTLQSFSYNADIDKVFHLYVISRAFSDRDVDGKSAGIPHIEKVFLGNELMHVI